MKLEKKTNGDFNINDLPGISNLQIIVNFISPIICYILSFAILKIKRKSRMHYALMVLLFNLATAFLFRGCGWLTSEFLFYKISYFFFIIMPISVTVFIEYGIKRQFERVTKLILSLAGLSLFANLMYTGDHFEGSWRILYIIYLSFSSAMLTVVSFLEIKNTRCKNERSILISITTSIFLTFIFLVIDLLNHYIIDLNFRFTSFSILIFVYFITSILYSNGSYSFTSYLNKITQFISMSILITFLIQFVLPEASLEERIDSGVLSFIIILSVSILNQIGGFRLEKGKKDILSKLISLNKDDSLSMLQDFAKWDEVIKVKVLGEKYLDDNHLDFIFENKDVMRSFDDVLTRTAISKLLKTNVSQDERNYLEALEYILKVTDTEFILPLEKRSEILTASFSYMMDANYFSDVLSYLGRELEIQFRKENSYV